MEFASHVKRIREEHCYAFSSVCSDSSAIEENSAVSQVSSKVSKNVAKEKQPKNKAKKNVRGFEFIDVSDIGNARESLEECMVSLDKDFVIEDCKGVAVDPLTEEELIPKKLLLEYQKQYKKKIETLQTFITNIVKATDKDALKLRANFLEEKIETLETRLKKNDAELKDLRKSITAEKTYKSLFNHLKTLEIENKNLNRQFNIMRHEKQLLEDHLGAQLKDSKIENENISRQLTTIVQQKNDLNNRFIELRVMLDAKKSELRESELRCSVLTRELESCTKKYIAQSTELSKERLDLEVVQKWLAETSRSQRSLKKQLAVVNEDLRSMREGQLTCEVRKTSGTPKRWPEKNRQRIEKRTRHFYDTDREKLLEDHDNKSREIGLELDVLRENVSMLRDVLAHRAELCSFLEEESQILREELRLKEVKQEDVKDEEVDDESVKMSPQLCD